MHFLGGEQLISRTLQEALRNLGQLLFDADEFPRVFIAYAPSDRDCAEELIKVISARGLDLEIELIDSDPKDKSYSELKSRMATCRWFLEIISPESLKAEWMQVIINYALIMERSIGKKAAVSIIVKGEDAEIATPISERIDFRERGKRKSSWLWGRIVMVFKRIRGALKSVQSIEAAMENQKGNYDRAIEKALAALASNKKDANAYFQLAVAYSYKGKTSEAYEAFQKSAILDPSKTRDAENNIEHNWALYFNCAVTEYQSGDIMAAASAFETAVKADPRETKGWLNLAKVYYSMALHDSTYLPRTYETVDTLLAKTKEDDESYANVLGLAGQIMVKRGMKEEALKIFEKLLLDDPANYKEVERAGNDYLAEKDWASGALFLQMAVDARKKTDSEDFESYYNLGVAYFNAKNCPQAIEAYLSAYDIDPENRLGNYSLLLSYYTCEMYDDAMLQGQKYTEKFPEDSNGWRLLSLSYSKKGMKIEAERAAQRLQDLTDNQNEI